MMESVYKRPKQILNCCTKIKYITAISQVNVPLEQFHSKLMEILLMIMTASHMYSTEISNFIPIKSPDTTEVPVKNYQSVHIAKTSKMVEE